MTRFVAVSVLTDEAGDVREGALQLEREELVELLEERLRTAEELYQSVNVMLHLPCVLPCVALGVVAAATLGMCKVARVERSLP